MLRELPALSGFDKKPFHSRGAEISTSFGNPGSVMDRQKACCSSPAAITYWFCVTIVAWAILSLIGAAWQPLHATSAITCLFAMAAGCFANWIRNRTYHCFIDGPLFLAAGSLFLLRTLGVVHFASLAIWFPLLFGVLISFWLEWRISGNVSDPR